MNKGVSLISLIITIIAIIILASITVFNSLDTVDEAQIARLEKEFNDVADFVRTVSSKAEAGMLDLNLSGDTLVTQAQLSTFPVGSEGSEYTSEEQNKIAALNASGRDPKFGYHYITGSQIENGIPGLDGISSNLEGLVNDYIINFYYGTVVARISSDRTIITGIVK